MNDVERMAEILMIEKMHRERYNDEKLWIEKREIADRNIKTNRFDSMSLNLASKYITYEKMYFKVLKVMNDCNINYFPSVNQLGPNTYNHLLQLLTANKFRERFNLLTEFEYKCAVMEGKGKVDRASKRGKPTT